VFDPVHTSGAILSEGLSVIDGSLNASAPLWDISDPVYTSATILSEGLSVIDGILKASPPGAQDCSPAIATLARKTVNSTDKTIVKKVFIIVTSLRDHFHLLPS